MEAFESFEHAGFTVELHTDEDPMSPAEWDTLGTLYEFGRAQWNGMQDAPGDVDEAHDRNRAGLTVRYLAARGEVAVLVQFQDYGSSGCRLLALDDDDDEIATGYISTTRKRIDELGVPAGDERRQLLGEIKEWDSYFQGEVVGYVVRESVQTLSGANVGEVVHSVWGFYPEHFTAEERAKYGRPSNDDDLEYVRTEAREAAEYERDERARRAIETVRGWSIAHNLAGAV